MIDGGEVGHDLGKAARRQHQGIAAGQDDLPYLAVRADIVERGRIGLIRQRALLARSDHLAAEAEPAIDRADMHELEQHAIGVAVDDAGHGRMDVIADRIGALGGLRHQFVRAWHELPRDGIVGIAGVDERCDVRRHCDRIARGDLLERGEIGSARKAVGDKLFRLAQRPCQIDPAHLSPAGGVHTT